MSITIKQLIAEHERELAMRQKVYPNWIVQGKLTQSAAEFRIKCIQETIKILKDLKFTGGITVKEPPKDTQLTMFKTNPLKTWKDQ